MEAPRSPLSPLGHNIVRAKSGDGKESARKARSAAKLARRVKTPKPKSSMKKKVSGAGRNVVNFGLFSPNVAKGESAGDGGFFKFTLAQTPGSAKKKKEEHLRAMRAQSLNKAAKCEAMGDYKGACDALVEEGNKPENVVALRSLKKRLGVQASLRKDRRGREAGEVCAKLDEVLKTFEESGPQVYSEAPKNLMEAFEGSAADLGSPASPEVLGSTQKLATFKASKAQQDALGSGVVTTPVRRSCRKEKPAVQEEDALETSGFAFAPNKFMMPEDDEVSSEGAVSEGEFAFDSAVGEKVGTNHSTPTLQFGFSDGFEQIEEEKEEEAAQVNVEQALFVNTPNFPKLVRQKPEITPRTAIAKVLATLLNNSVKEGATVTAAAPKMPAKTPAWKSPGRTRNRLFSSKASTPVGSEEDASVAKSLNFARKIDETDGAIDHKVEVAAVPSQDLTVEDCTSDSLPQQPMEEATGFHSGLTPNAAVMKSPVKEMIKKYDEIAELAVQPSPTPVEAPAPAEMATPEQVKEKPRRKSILKKPIETTEEAVGPSDEAKRTQRKKSVRFSSGSKEAKAEEKVAEVAPRRSTRGSKKATEAVEPSAAPTTRRSRRLAAAPSEKSTELVEKTVKEKTATVEYTEEQIMSWRVVDLRAALKKAGLSTTGLKKVLQERALENLL